MGGENAVWFLLLFMSSLCAKTGKHVQFSSLYLAVHTGNISENMPDVPDQVIVVQYSNMQIQTDPVQYRQWQERHVDLI